VHGDTTEMVLDSLALRTPGNDWHLDHPAHVRSDRSGITLDSVVARGAVAGWIAAKAKLPPTGMVAIHVSGDSIPLADLGALAQSLDQAGGTAGFDLNIANTRQSPIMRFTARLKNARLGEVGLDEILTDGHYRNHQLDLHTDFVQYGDTALHVHVYLPVDLALENIGLRTLDDSLRGELRSDSAKLSTILGVLPDVSDPSGWFTANVDLGGTWRHPTLDGQVRVADGALGLANLGVRWNSLNARLDLNGDSLSLSRVSLATEENDRRGVAALGGWITFADIDNPKFDIWLRAEHLHVIDRLRLANLTVSTKTSYGSIDTLRLRGSEQSSELTGTVVVDQGSIFLPDFNKKQIVNLDDPELYNLVDTSLLVNRRLLPNGPPKLVAGLNLKNVSIDLGTDTWLKSTEANINLSGTVDVTTARLPRDTTRALALTGAVSATRGSYVLNLGLVQRTFTVEQAGTITFTGEPEFNPQLDITAVNIVHPSGQSAQYVRPELRIQVHLGGTLDHLQLGLSSADSLPQSDLISYLVSGVPSYELNQANSGALATSIVLPTIGSAVGSRLTGGLFDTFQVQTYGYQQGRVAAPSAFSQARIGAGKQVGPDTFISADYGFCSGSQGANPGYQLGVRVDQRLTRQLSLSAASSPGTTYAYCTGSGGYSGFIPTPRQYGLDLFRSWSF
jgi:translocation and assembly module TamB